MPLYRGSRRLILARRVGGLDPATTAWVAAVVTASGSVSGAQQTRVDTLIKAYKSAGVWTILDRVWLLAAENTQQANIDLVNLATWTALSAPTFSANVGYVSDAGAGINSNFTPSTAGGNYTQNSAHIGAYVTVAGGTTNHAAIGVDVGGVFSYFEPATATTAFDMNGATFPSGTPAAAIGQYIATRIDSLNVAIYRNGNTTPIGSHAADTSGALATNPFSIFAINGFGHAMVVGDTLAAVQIGGGVNSTQMASMMSAMNAYQAAIGNSVY